MRVKRSEAVRTRMETRRQRTRMATLMNNVATSTNGGRAVLTVQRNEERAKREAVLETEDVLLALRDKLDEKPDYMVRNVEDPGVTLASIGDNNAIAVSSSAFGLSGSAALQVQNTLQPNSFVKKGAHVLSSASDEELDNTLDVILRGDNSEAVFHYTGDDLKRLIFRKLTTLDEKIQMLENLANFANGRIDAIERYGDR